MNFKQVTSLKIPEGNVLQINSGSQILWQSKNRYDLPDGYEAVDWLMAPASVGAYIDLDLKFAIAGRAEMELYVEDKSATAYPFGAVENSGKTRFCLSAPYNTNATFYFSKNGSHTEYSSSLALGKNDIVLAVTGGKGLLEN